MQRNLTITKLENNESAPMPLLLLADPSEKNILKYLNKSDVYVALENEVIIGVYLLKEIGPSKVELMNIAVAESHQGKGLGKALVQHAIEAAKNSGMQSIELGTGNSSIQQLALYQKCGFRMKEIVHDFFVINYDEPIFENGIHCRDMVRLGIDLSSWAK
ncbi:GNAT family N-acetyltransferase [Solibacillus sp. FSL H8-0523]|uniref:GNAT family N-acetyltransferase n=1 Tax=Solibacillus sp. FSL H8-0523 TaxID=2954511 RepID=UPI003100EAE5